MMQMSDKVVEPLLLERKNWHGLTITDAAAKQIRYLVKIHARMLGLRLSIKSSGCAGFGYVINQATSSKDNDLVYEHKGAKLFVSITAMPFIDGTELDYVQEGLNHFFKFNNPKAQYACGCGESFGI